MIRMIRMFPSPARTSVSAEFVFDAQLLCLDFVNTRILQDGEPLDLLGTPEALADWVRTASRIHDLERDSGEGAARDDANLRGALRLRDAVRSAADAGIDGSVAPERAVRVINEAARTAPLVLRAERTGGGFRRRRLSAGAPVAAVLGDVARSAIRLVTELDSRRLGRCSHPECILYYYDVTRNRSRRWCSMERCGNRAKAAAHYRRSKRAAAGDGEG